MSNEEFDPLKSQNFSLTTKQSDNTPKVTKEKHWRSFVKEIKRIIWPKIGTIWKWFAVTCIFVLVFSIFFFIVTLLFTNLWANLGIKL
ncbi:preprotein translocase subunit SecE [Mycoplasma phocoenae]|uniref:Preprotein translocase subunit SecE n=1 Tax=Mycoplasma phocoenae TaxID=754517 RepID=A0A858U802_9MOLU|nr:preprotein translocase subunit SecE [Mycoplasma phocoenae]QJG66898.1 preprotein translocase subunit SecE [Mycoplasma phocoenae]